MANIAAMEFSSPSAESLIPVVTAAEGISSLTPKPKPQVKLGDCFQNFPVPAGTQYQSGDHSVSVKTGVNGNKREEYLSGDHSASVNPV